MILFLLYVLACAMMGALTRREMGGWGGFSRLGCYAGVFVTVLAAGVGPAVIVSPLPWWAAVPFAAAVAGLILLFFICGFVPGPIDKPTRARVWLKYGPFAAGYALAWKYWPDVKGDGAFIDGPNAIGELFLGGSVYASLAILSHVVMVALT